MGAKCSEERLYASGGYETNQPRMFSFRALSKRRVCACILGSIFACLAITADLSMPMHGDYEPVAFNLVWDFCSGFVTPDKTPMLALMGIGVTFLFLFGARRVWFREQWPVVLLSLFFAFAMVCGWMLDNGYDIGVLIKGKAQVLKAALAFTAWTAIAYAGITLVFQILDKTVGAEETPWKSFKESPGNQSSIAARLLCALDRYPFCLPFAVLLIVWTPFIIGVAPGMFMGDTDTQICMWYGLPHNRLAGTVLIDPEVTWTTHHPVLHTAIIGACLQFGETLFGDVNYGIMAYTLLQVFADITCISYALRVAHSVGVSAHVRAVLLAMFCFVPWYPIYATLLTKDTLFAAAMLMLCMQFVMAWKERTEHDDGAVSLKRIVLIGVFSLLTALLRNGALLFAVCGVLAFALSCLAKGSIARKQTCACLAIVVVAVMGFNSVIVPALHIAPGSKVEMLSVPFQQTARYVVEHPKDISDSERAAIDAILGYKGLAERYDPLNADPVKDHAASVCREASSQDWKAYFAAWANMGSRHPGCYVEATLHNYYGYFYPSQNANQLYRIPWSEEVMAQVSEVTGRDFHRISIAPAEEFTEVYEAYTLLFRRVPILSLLMNAAFWCWMLLLVTAYAIRRRWVQSVPLLLMLWLVMLVFLVGPINATIYSRYVYPIAYMLPIVIVILPAFGKSLSENTNPHSRK